MTTRIRARFVSLEIEADDWRAIAAYFTDPTVEGPLPRAVSAEIAPPRRSPRPRKHADRWTSPARARYRLP